MGYTIVSCNKPSSVALNQNHAVVKRWNNLKCIINDSINIEMNISVT